MPNSQTQQAPDNTTSFADRLAARESVTKPKAAKPESVKTEPTMRALRRILGPSVLDIFPAGIAEHTDALYKICAEDDEFWAAIPCATLQERNDLLSLMKAYAECAGDKGYTVRQDRTSEPTVLRIRVTDRRGSKGDESTPDSQPNASTGE